MSSIHQVFNKLVANSTVSVATGSPRGHENLRTYLSKLYSTHKETMNGLGFASSDSTILGVSANYCPDTGISTFVIKRVVGGRRGVDFKIVEESN